MFLPAVNLITPVNRFHPLNRGLISWWLVMPGNDAGSKLVDIMNPVAGGNHGTLTNMDTANVWKGASRPGSYGALNYNSVDGYVDVSDSPSLDTDQDYSLVAWVNRAGQGDANNAIIGRKPAGGTAGHYYLHIKNSTNKFNFDIPFVANNIVTSVTETSTNTWYHVVLTKLSTTYRLYVDGIEEDNAVNSSAPTTEGDVNIGRLHNNQHFNGLLDDVRICNRALAKNEIQSLYYDSLLGYPNTLNWIEHRGLAVPAAAAGLPAGSLALLGVGV